MTKGQTVVNCICKYTQQCLLRSATQKIVHRSCFFVHPISVVPGWKTSPSLSTFSQILTNNVYSSHFHHVRGYAKGAIVKDKKSKTGKPKVQMSDDELREVFNLDSMKRQMQLVVDRLKSDYVKNLTLRSSGSIERLPVLIDGDEFPLNEIAQLVRKNPELIVVNMTNFPEGIKPAMEAIASIGFNPQQDGTMVYVSIPKITREHRQNLAASAKTQLNKAKDAIKEVQNKYVREVKKNKDGLSEDIIFNSSEHIHYICLNYIQEAEKVFNTKEKDLLGE